jgi:hypothetical protein
VRKRKRPTTLAQASFAPPGGWGIRKALRTPPRGAGYVAARCSRDGYGYRPADRVPKVSRCVDCAARAAGQARCQLRAATCPSWRRHDRPCRPRNELQNVAEGTPPESVMGAIFESGGADACL